jgi:catecholate siderophore receptor
MSQKSLSSSQQASSSQASSSDVLDAGPGSWSSSLRNFAMVPTLLMAAGAVQGQSVTDSSGAAKSTDSNAGTRKLADVVVEGEVAPVSARASLTEPLRDTPKTITVIKREVFEQQGATTLRDVLRNTPGITFQAGEGGTPAGDQMTIRGFSARTDLFIDGVRDTGGYARDAFNIEAVEVTKGPSSSEAGRGSTGGSINLVSKTPQLTAFRTGTAGVGTSDYRRATVDLNEPLSQSPVAGTAFRLNAMYQDSEVAGRDEVTNSSWAVAPSLALGLGTPTKAVLSYLHLEQDNLPDYGIPWVPVTNTALAPYAGEAPPVSYNNFYGLKKRDHEDVQNDLLTADLSHEVGDNFTLRNLSRYGRTRRDSITTAPRFLSDNATTLRRTDWKSRDQNDEILANITHFTGTVATGSVTHDLAAGLELSREEMKNHTRVKTGSDSPNTDLYRPNPDDAYNEAIARNGAYTRGRAESAAAYLFDTLKLGTRWQVIGGLRWDRFDADYDAVAADGSYAPLSRTDEMVSWKGGLVYKPRENGSLYAAYGTSFNPSAEGLTLTTATVLIEPEKTRSYEVGTKWDLLNNGLSVSAALFRTEKSNARTAGVNAGDPPTVLEGKQHVDGVEVGVSGKITRRWSAFAGYAYMESEIENSNTPAEIHRELPLTPRSTANLWTTYEFTREFSIGGGAQYMGSVYRNATNVSSVPSYWLFNAMATYTVSESLTFRLNLNNVADKHYADRPSGGHFIPGPGRTALLTADFKF